MNDFTAIFTPARRKAATKLGDLPQRHMAICSKNTQCVKRLYKQLGALVLANTTAFPGVVQKRPWRKREGLILHFTWRSVVRILIDPGSYKTLTGNNVLAPRMTSCNPFNPSFYHCGTMFWHHA